VIVCPGPDYDRLGPELTPHREGLTRCKLQMLRVASPGGRRYRSALLTGLSLLRYPGYDEQPASGALRARVEAERPELIAAGVHLIVTQLPGGDLLLGDTHEYGDTVSPFGAERLDELVLAEARQLLGAERLTVRQRWHGVYPSAPGHPFLIAEPLPGVAVVEIVSGVGMTTALGLAPRTLDALTAAGSALALG
jgi:FAD dependent oxidoreductase TIGR03364